MVAIVVTPEIRDILSAAPPRSAPTDAVTTTDTLSTVPHAALLSALRAHAMNRPDAATPALHSLLRATTVHASHAAAARELLPAPRDATVAARVAALRAAEENRAYAAMTARLTPGSGGAQSAAQRDAERLSRLAPQLSLAANVVVTMATCFTAAYFLFWHSTHSRTVALVAGVVALVGAMAVEAVLLVTKLYAVDKAAREDERKRAVRIPSAARGSSSAVTRAEQSAQTTQTR